MSLLSPTKKYKKFIITYDLLEGVSKTLNVRHDQYSKDRIFRQNISEIKCMDCHYHSKFHHKIFHVKKNHYTHYYCEPCNTSYPSFKSLAEDHPLIIQSDLTISDTRTVKKSYTKKIEEGI